MRIIRIMCTALFVCSALAPRAEAEWLADLYAGAAFTQNRNVDVTLGGADATLSDVRFDTSFSTGGRFGYWFDFIGLALDASYYRPNVDTQSTTLTASSGRPFGVTLNDVDIRAAIVSLDIMARIPLMKDQAFPHGRLTPYAFAGPAAFISKMEVQNQDSNTNATIGVRAGGGVSYMFTRLFGVFGEYQFTYAKPDYSFGVAGSELKISPPLLSHHLVVGVAFRF